MHKIDIVGLDLAKNIFQVHAIAADGAVVVKRQVRRSQVLSFFARLPPCLIGMEACGGRTTGHARSKLWAMRSA